MTVSVPEATYFSYVTDGATTAFSFPLRFLASDDLIVETTISGVTSVVSHTGLTITGAGEANGGTVTFATAPAAGTLTIRRDTAAKQIVDLANLTKSNSESVETQLDRLAMVQQDHGRDRDRSWKSPVGSPGGTITVGAEGTVPKFDADGNLVEGPSAAELEGAEGYAEDAAQSASDAHNDRIGAETAQDKAEDAQAAAESAAAGVNLPPIVAADAGKLLFVTDDGNGYQLGAPADTAVATRSALKALKTNNYTSARLTESGREGRFTLREGAIPVTDTYEGWFIPSDTTGYYWERVSDVVYCDDFGPNADGATSDHLILTAAAKVAAYLKKPIVLCRGAAKTYALSSNWEITNGVPAVLHGGGTLKFTHTSSTFISVLLKGKHSGETSNVTDCLVSLRLDCNGKYSWGITGENCSRVLFFNNRILNNTGVGYGLHIHAYEDGGESALDNKFIGNFIASSVATPTNSTFGIMLWADSDGSADMPAYWLAHHSVPAPTYWVWRTTITGNTIVGGHYAISGNSAIETAVSGNVCTNNIRSMSFQNRSDLTVIGPNVCRQFYSSCIHLAYGTSDCLVEGVNGYSSIAVGEGSLQSYVGTKRNTFRGNKINITGGTGPRYHAYAAIDIADIVYDGNEFTGSCTNAYVGIESGWVETATNPAQRPSGADAEDYSSIASAGVEITNNTFRGASAVPAVFLSQVQQTLKGVLWSGNKYKTTSVSKVLELYETSSGDLADIIADGNVYPPTGITGGKFTLPRGRAHFAAATGRLFSDGPDVVGFTASDLTPSVAVGRTFAVNSSGTGSITMFDDGMDGQEITVRLAGNSNGITHDNSKIRLKGGANVSGVDSNSWIHFIRASGVWFETGRSF